MNDPAARSGPMVPDAATLAAYAEHAGTDADAWLAQPPPIDLQDAVRRWFRPGASGGVTADVGCGSGRDVDWLNRHGYPCVGFDASDALLAEAGRRFPEWRFERAALPRLDAIAPRTFDNLVCETVLMHLPRDAVFDAVDALRRVLRPGGLLYLSWRMSNEDHRDERGRLYTALDAAFVQDTLAGMETLYAAGTISASSGQPIHTIVARATGRRHPDSPGREVHERIA